MVIVAVRNSEEVTVQTRHASAFRQAVGDDPRYRIRKTLPTGDPQTRVYVVDGFPRGTISFNLDMGAPITAAPTPVVPTTTAPLTGMSIAPERMTPQQRAREIFSRRAAGEPIAPLQQPTTMATGFSIGTGALTQQQQQTIMSRLTGTPAVSHAGEQITQFVDPTGAIVAEERKAMFAPAFQPRAIVETPFGFEEFRRIDGKDLPTLMGISTDLWKEEMVRLNPGALKKDLPFVPVVSTALELAAEFGYGKIGKDIGTEVGGKAGADIGEQVGRGATYGLGFMIPYVAPTVLAEQAFQETMRDVLSPKYTEAQLKQLGGLRVVEPTGTVEYFGEDVPIPKEWEVWKPIPSTVYYQATHRPSAPERMVSGFIEFAQEKPIEFATMFAVGGMPSIVKGARKLSDVAGVEIKPPVSTARVVGVTESGRPIIDKGVPFKDYITAKATEFKDLWKFPEPVTRKPITEMSPGGVPTVTKYVPLLEIPKPSILGLKKQLGVEVSHIVKKSPDEWAGKIEAQYRDLLGTGKGTIKAGFTLTPGKKPGVSIVKLSGKLERQSKIDMTRLFDLQSKSEISMGTDFFTAMTGGKLTQQRFPSGTQATLMGGRAIPEIDFGARGLFVKGKTQPIIELGWPELPATYRVGTSGFEGLIRGKQFENILKIGTEKRFSFDYMKGKPVTELVPTLERIPQLSLAERTALLKGGKLPTKVTVVKGVDVYRELGIFDKEIAESVGKRGRIQLTKDIVMNKELMKEFIESEKLRNKFFEETGAKQTGNLRRWFGRDYAKEIYEQAQMEPPPGIPKPPTAKLIEIPKLPTKADVKMVAEIAAEQTMAAIEKDVKMQSPKVKSLQGRGTFDELVRMGEKEKADAIKISREAPTHFRGMKLPTIFKDVVSPWGKKMIQPMKVASVSSKAAAKLQIASQKKQQKVLESQMQMPGQKQDVFQSTMLSTAQDKDFKTLQMSMIQQAQQQSQQQKLQQDQQQKQDLLLVERAETQFTDVFEVPFERGTTRTKRTFIPLLWPAPKKKEISVGPSKQYVYNVDVKSEKKWKNVGKGMPRGQALSRGASVVDEYPSARFRISRGQKKKSATGIDSVMWDILKPKFRPYKIRKGKKIPMKEEFIERSGFRIDSPGELMGITFKGVRASRKKSKKTPFEKMIGV